MKIRIELLSEGDEELVIRCHEITDRILALERELSDMTESEGSLLVSRAGTDYYIPISHILFFESSNRKTYAHTAEGIYVTDYKLFELEERLPSTFVRISKSAIANILQIASLKRELVGNGELTFKGSDRKAYFSRGYYHVMRDRLDEVRLRKK